MRKAAVVLLMVLGAGCGSSSAPTSSAPVGTTPTTSSPVSPTTPSPAVTTASPTPSPTPTAYAMGETAITPRGNELTAYSWQRGVDWPIDPDAGKDFSHIDVEACLKNDDQGPLPMYDFSQGWTLEMPDHASISSENISYNGDELIGQNKSIGLGECARGVVVFQVPKGKTPAFVVYSSSVNLRWAVGSA